MDKGEKFKCPGEKKKHITFNPDINSGSHKTDMFKVLKENF